MTVLVILFLCIFDSINVLNIALYVDLFGTKNANLKITKPSLFPQYTFYRRDLRTGHRKMGLGLLLVSSRNETDRLDKMPCCAEHV